MASTKVISTHPQPIILNLRGGRSMKIPARSTVEVEEADLNSDEMAFHLSRGHISVVDVAVATVAERKSEPKPAAAASEPRRTHKEDKGGE